MASLSYSALISNGTMTLPSVVGGLGTTNVIKDPPKSITTRRIDKVGSNMDLLNYVQNTPNRLCDTILRFSRGTNPMTGITMTNNGGNAGGNFVQGRRTGSGVQASLPRKIMVNGAFRPPIVDPRDLLPLSRQPRSTTSVPTYFKKDDGTKIIFERDNVTAIQKIRAYAETNKTEAAAQQAQPLHTDKKATHRDIIQWSFVAPLQGRDTTQHKNALHHDVRTLPTTNNPAHTSVVTNTLTEKALYKPTTTQQSILTLATQILATQHNSNPNGIVVHRINQHGVGIEQAIHDRIKTKASTGRTQRRHVKPLNILPTNGTVTHTKNISQQPATATATRQKMTNGKPRIHTPVLSTKADAAITTTQKYRPQLHITQSQPTLEREWTRNTPLVSMTSGHKGRSGRIDHSVYSKLQIRPKMTVMGRAEGTTIKPPQIFHPMAH